MVFDWLIDAKTGEHKPLRMLLLSAIYTFVATIIAAFIFPREASAVMLVLIIMAFTPLMINLMKIEELRDERKHFLFKEHTPAIELFIAMFLGMFVASTLAYVILPSNIVANLFSMQMDTLAERGIEFGAIFGRGTFFHILFNNLAVLAIGILLTFIFGAGAIFILTWNSSVLAALIGGAIRHNLDFSVMRYLIHGIPEIGAYFVGGLAGGIVSIGIARHKFGTKDFNKIMLDSTELIFLAVLILIVAAALEVGVSPLIG